jgi:hypothetical protein
VGFGTLSISFEAVLNDDMAGFYKSKYIVNGETRYLREERKSEKGAKKQKDAQRGEMQIKEEEGER